MTISKGMQKEGDAVSHPDRAELLGENKGLLEDKVQADQPGLWDTEIGAR